MHTRRSLKASRLPHLPNSFSTPLSSFGSVDPILSSTEAVSRPNLPLSFTKSASGFSSVLSSFPSCYSRQTTFPLSRSSLRSIRQVQVDISRNSNFPRRFSTFSPVSNNLPLASHFTSLPLPTPSSTFSKQVPFGVQTSPFFALQRVSFSRNALRHFFARRRSSDSSTRRFRQSPTLIEPGVGENVLITSSQTFKTVETTRFSSSWAVGFSRPNYATVSATLTLLTGSAVHLTRVPALSVARFAHDRETLLYSATQRASRLGTTSSPFAPSSSYSASTLSVGLPSSAVRPKTTPSTSALATFLYNRYRFTFRSEASRALSSYNFSVISAAHSPLSGSVFSTALADSRSTSSRRGNVATAVLPRLTSAALLRTLERSRGRFQRTAVHLPDLLRLGFIARYFKKADLLAALFSWALAALPRTRKETLFVRFLIKLLKVLATQRPERVGLRIRFKGRVNRWRRTKQILGSKGSVPLYTYNARLEVGDSQAITRKGTLGIRVWLAYDPRFSTALRAALFTYVRGSSFYSASSTLSELNLSSSPLSPSFNPAQFSSQFDTVSELFPSPRTPLARPSV